MRLLFIVFICILLTSARPSFAVYICAPVKYCSHLRARRLLFAFVRLSVSVCIYALLVCWLHLLACRLLLAFARLSFTICICAFAVCCLHLHVCDACIYAFVVCCCALVFCCFSYARLSFAVCICAFAVCIRALVVIHLAFVVCPPVVCRLSFASRVRSSFAYLTYSLFVIVICSSFASRGCYLHIAFVVCISCMPLVYRFRRLYRGSTCIIAGDVMTRVVAGDAVTCSRKIIGCVCCGLRLRNIL